MCGRMESRSRCCRRMCGEHAVERGCACLSEAGTATSHLRIYIDLKGLGFVRVGDVLKSEWPPCLI